MDENNPHEPKIGGIEAGLMIGTAAFFDILDFLATLLDGFFGAGEIIKPFINAVAFLTLWLWAMMKDVGAERTAAAGLLEFVPLINSLPIRTIGTIATIWLDRHPEEAKIISTGIPAIKNPRRAIGLKNRSASKPVKTNPSA
jgi:phage-related protein